jgi:hypothetical protein
MAKRRLTTKARRFAAALCRGFAVLAVGAKLLVPVGYMSASLADGGPIMLCGSGLPASLLLAHGHAAPGDADTQSGHASSAFGHVHAASQHDHALSGAETAAPGSELGYESTQDDQPSSEQHQWERCSLGGLASLAAFTAEWRFELPAVAPERVASYEHAVTMRAGWLAFRSRAPPITLS